MAADAFEMRWADFQGYANSPFSLVGRCLCKVIQEGCTIVLIAPVWPAHARFPILLKCLVEYPVLLPRHCLLLTDPFNRNYMSEMSRCYTDIIMFFFLHHMT